MPQAWPSSRRPSRRQNRLEQCEKRGELDRLAERQDTQGEQTCDPGHNGHRDARELLGASELGAEVHPVIVAS